MELSRLRAIGFVEGAAAPSKKHPALIGKNTLFIRDYHDFGQSVVLVKFSTVAKKTKEIRDKTLSKKSELRTKRSRRKKNPRIKN